jgi:hypothetical protein
MIDILILGLIEIIGVMVSVFTDSLIDKIKGKRNE